MRSAPPSPVLSGRQQGRVHLAEEGWAPRANTERKRAAKGARGVRARGSEFAAAYQATHKFLHPRWQHFWLISWPPCRAIVVKRFIAARRPFFSERVVKGDWPQFSVVQRGLN